jgi:hypothetical protein
VKVFFITDRDEQHRDATTRGLAGHGFPAPTGGSSVPSTMPRVPAMRHPLQVVEDKFGHRAHLVGQGNTILGNRHDLRSDWEVRTEGCGVGGCVPSSQGRPGNRAAS